MPDQTDVAMWWTLSRQLAALSQRNRHIMARRLIADVPGFKAAIMAELAAGLPHGNRKDDDRNHALRSLIVLRGGKEGR